MGRLKYLLPIGFLLALAAVGAFWVTRDQSHPARVTSSAPTPSQSPPPAVSPPADCLRPGPAPATPNGGTATAADMQLAHAVTQHFVEQLEGYQACRNSQVDHAAPTVSDQQKQAWVNEGNSAIDDANGLAAAFSQQLKIFKARQAAQH